MEAQNKEQQRIEEQVKETLKWSKDNVTLIFSHAKTWNFTLVEVRAIRKTGRKTRNFLGSGVLSDLNSIGGKLNSITYYQKEGLSALYKFDHKVRTEKLAMNVIGHPLSEGEVDELINAKLGSYGKDGVGYWLHQTEWEYAKQVIAHLNKRGADNE